MVKRALRGRFISGHFVRRMPRKLNLLLRREFVMPGMPASRS